MIASSENNRLRQQIDHLKRQVDEARRAGFRQAAPFAKPLKTHPQRPGRKPGSAYGPKARRRRPARVDDVQRFAAHLTRESTAIWSFLFDPTIDATNCRAEHAIRPAVVTRKVWGGNRTWRGAHAQQTLGSIIRTAHQRHLDPHAVLVSMLHAREPIVPPAFQATTAN